MIHNGPFDPPPEDFRAVFIKDGWRGVERFFGARTSVINRWIEESGGLDQLRIERRAYREAMRVSVADGPGMAKG